MANAHQRSIVAHIRSLGLAANCHDGEYRITWPNLPCIEAEQLAYYTTSNLDAMQTATQMARL